MIAGTGVSSLGGAGMLRARRRDISIKPNRKLDRKSSRGMMYENEELRLRTIHINAEVEQGQNDIKKLRRENEQLRREIWSLRDEYDKLEEILKKQKTRDESDECENRSDEDDELGSEFSEDDDDDDEEEEDNDTDKEEDDNEDDDDDEEECLENAENQKISTEKLNNSAHRIRVNFDDLSVVDEEEELKKDQRKEPVALKNEAETDADARLQNHIVFHKTPYDTSSSVLNMPRFGYQPECPFVFPNPSHANYSNIGPADRGSLLMAACPQMYASTLTQSEVSPNSVGTAVLNSDVDVSSRNNHLQGTSSIGWQSSVLDSGAGSSITSSKFPSGNMANVSESPGAFSTGMNHTSPKNTVIETANFGAFSKQISPGITKMHNNQSVNAMYSDISNALERRNAFLKQQKHVLVSKLQEPMKKDSLVTEQLNRPLGTTTITVDSENSKNVTEKGPFTVNRRKHFFAPLFSRHNVKKPIESRPMQSTVVNGRLPTHKGTADIYVNGAVPHQDNNEVEENDQRSFLSVENLLFLHELKTCSSNGSNNTLIKSVSCQDFTDLQDMPNNESLKTLSTEKLTKSDNALDNISTVSRPFRSHLNVVLKNPQLRRPSRSITPEIETVPSIDFKLFNNPFLQGYDRSYRNFAELSSPSPATKPLSVQINSNLLPDPSYSTPSVVDAYDFNSTLGADLGVPKRKASEDLRLRMPSITDAIDGQPFQVTSFESPSPQTVQIPPLTPFDLESLRKMPTPMKTFENKLLYQNVPFVPRAAAVYCSGQTTPMLYDTATKVPAQTQTSLETESTSNHRESQNGKKSTTVANIENPSEPSSPTEQIRRKSTKRGRTASVKEKKIVSPSTRRQKDKLKKQTSTTSEVSEMTVKSASKMRIPSDIQDDKNDSRSSSSGQESPRKDHARRVSLYFNAKKRPSLTSVKTTRSGSVENSRERRSSRGENIDTTNSERERTNSVSSREIVNRTKGRKSSTSSGSVPWCACWGNGCI